MVVPIPFSRALFLYGEPMRIPRGAGVEEERVRVERALNELTDEAETNFDALWEKR